MTFIIFIYKNESTQQHFKMNYCLYYPFTDLRDRLESCFSFGIDKMLPVLIQTFTELPLCCRLVGSIGEKDE